jgi:pyruvate/2-oxoglutarate dehydrogenase complex dihydrolipoamide acyltransferase (E2) component
MMSELKKTAMQIQSSARDWKYFLLILCVLLSSIVLLEATKKARALTAALTAPTVTEVYSPDDAVIVNISAENGQTVDANEILMTLSRENSQQKHIVTSPISGTFSFKKSAGDYIRKGDIVGVVIPNIDSNQLYFKVLNGDVSELNTGDKLEIVIEKETYLGSLAMIIGDVDKTSYPKLLIQTTAALSLNNKSAQKKYTIKKQT